MFITKIEYWSKNKDKEMDDESMTRKDDQYTVKLKPKGLNGSGSVIRAYTNKFLHKNCNFLHKCFNWYRENSRQKSYAWEIPVPWVSVKGSGGKGGDRLPQGRRTLN